MKRRRLLAGIISATVLTSSAVTAVADGYHPDTAIQITPVRQNHQGDELVLTLLLDNRLDDPLLIRGIYSNIGILRLNPFPQQLTAGQPKIVMMSVQLPEDAPDEISLTLDLGNAVFQSFVIDQTQSF